MLINVKEDTAKIEVAHNGYYETNDLEKLCSAFM